MIKGLPNFKRPPDARFFLKLIDENGILQHSRFSSPTEVCGYSLDDNARALIVAAQYYLLYQDIQFKELIKKFLRFLKSQQTKEGEFHNYLFVSFGNRFLTHELAEDSFGETIWALGYILSLDLGPEINQKAFEIFRKSLEKTKSLKSLRTKAYCLAGLSFYLQAEENFEVRDLALKLAIDLKKAFERNKDKEWLWFEDILIYANAILPLSLLLVSKILEKNGFLETGCQSLDFLIKKTMVQEVPAPIGQRGWYQKGEEKALFDQQPIEAGYMVLACLAAYKMTAKERYLKLARSWFAWFYGHNLVGLSLIDKKDGGCYDGLEPWKVNLNKGAESTVCYLLAYLAMANEKKFL